MTPAARAGATIARTEVIAPAGTDPVAARLRVERLLGALDLRPRGLPPRAILCVRELRDPLPGCLSIAGRNTSAPVAWQQAVQRELERVHRASAWPGRGDSPVAAPAVAFDDETDLLACLGSDLATGHLVTRWWWPLLVDARAPPERAVGAAWLRAVEHVPAALQRLAERGRAVPFVRALDEDDASALVVAIDRCFALPASVSGAGLLKTSDGSEGNGLGEARARASVQEPPPPVPWRLLVPEAGAGDLTLPQRLLLGTALTLVRAPLRARSASFLAERLAWRVFIARATAHGESPIPGRAPTASREPSRTLRFDGAQSTLAHRASNARFVGETTSPSNGGATAERNAAVGDASPFPGPRSPSAPSPDTSLAAPAPPDPRRLVARTGAAPADVRASVAPDLDAGCAPVAAAAPARPSPSAVDVETDPAPAPAPASADRRLLSLGTRARAWGQPTDTDLGGLFYLVNLALYLDLYGDGENLALPLWDFVSLVGCELLGPRAAHTAHDPVWPLLAALAGREADADPGAEFVPPPEWRLPPRWLDPFPAARAPARADVRERRLCVAHADGFLLLDLPIDSTGDAHAQLARELGPYVTVTSALESDHVAPSASWVAPSPRLPPLGRWMAWVLPYLRARLARALDVDAAELAPLLLQHHARVHVNDTHVDVSLSLDELPIAIRVAGLDRDPGWVAAAGRFVAFHFEDGRS